MQSAGDQLASLSHETNYVAKVEPPPAGLPSSVKYVTSTQYTDNSKTPPAVVGQDSFTVTRGRVEVAINFQGSSAMTPDVEMAVLTALDSRLQR